MHTIATDDPVRFAEVAFTTGLKPGTAVDLLAGWELVEDHVEVDRGAKEDPYLLIVSRRAKLLKAHRDRSPHHLELTCRYKKDQIRRGKYVLRAHPQEASSLAQDRRPDVSLDYGIDG